MSGSGTADSAATDQAGHGSVSALVIVFVIGLPAVSYRRWRAGTAIGPSPEAATPGRAARIGFHSEMAVASAIIIAFFLGAMFTVGTVRELNNAMYTTGRTRAYWILIAHLLASIGLVVWAVHQWVHRSRLAFLVALLVIVSTLITSLVTIRTIL